MAGSLKVTCAAGQRWMARVTPTFSTLQNKAACSVSFWLAIDAIDASAIGNFLVTGNVNPVACAAGGGGAGVRKLSFIMFDAAGSNKLSYTLDPIDIGNGHHVVLAYDGTMSTMYLDGVVVDTQASQGPTLNTATNFRIGWDDSTHAVTLRLADAAFWGAETLTQSEVIQLRNREKTPGTLGRPATNWWKWQGTHGEPAVVSAGGMLDEIGTNHFDALVFATGTGIYDAAEIQIQAAALYMTPYVDTTGYLLFIPLYLNSAVTPGGPVKPTLVNVPPVFTVAGVVVAPTLIVLDGYACFICYQFATPVGPGQVVTMSCDIGWAVAGANSVGGSSPGGIGSTPVTCLNYAGQDTDYPTTGIARTLGLALNTPPFAGIRGYPGQVMANWARRIVSQNPGTGATNWIGTGTVTAFDVNNMPSAISGGYVTGTVDNAGNAANGIDDNGIPGIAGVWTLVYGDNTTGVGPSTHVISMDLAIGSNAWTIAEIGGGYAGDWDGSAWHGIKKLYSITYNLAGGPLATGGGLPPIVSVRITRVAANAGPVGIPILANGQSELGVFPPSAMGALTSTPITFDPMAVDPHFLRMHANAPCLRWMANQALMTTTGDGNFTYPDQLTAREPTAFLSTNQTTISINVTRIDPVSDTTTVIADYINGDATGTIAVTRATWTTAYRSRALYLITTATPHGMHTGDKFTLTPTSVARAAVYEYAGITLTAGVTTTGQTVFVLNQTVDIDGSLGSDITEGTILQIGSATTDEQVVVTAIAGLNVTVTRATHGTTALTRPSGTVCYICQEIIASGINQMALVVSPTQFFQYQLKLTIPLTVPDPTLLYAQTYSAGSCPIFNRFVPHITGTTSYELCAKATSDVAAANESGECICWVCVPFMATDAAVTATVNRMIPYLSAGVRLIVQCSNEVFNSAFDQSYLAVVLMVDAPNPQAGGRGFSNYNHYLASRQHQFNLLTRAAFTANGLNPNRVIWGHSSHTSAGVTQPDTTAVMVYCQTHTLPVELVWNASYADMKMGDVLGPTYVSWLPASTGVAGAVATWTMATCRAVMMSYYRASLRFSAVWGCTVMAATQAISRYNHGVSVDGSSPTNTNPVRARLCTYEGATTMPLVSPFPGGATPIFPQCSAFTHDLLYDPAWYHTEIAYYQAVQEAGHTYALLMTPAQFPDPDDAVVLFNAYYNSCYFWAPTNNTIGYAYPQYTWMAQPAGPGTGNLMGWHPTTPVIRDMSTDGATIKVNESVRGQAALDWIASQTPTPTPTPTPTGTGISLQSGVLLLLQDGSAALLEG